MPYEQDKDISGHIVNVKIIRGIKAITTYEGYKDLMICSSIFRVYLTAKKDLRCSGKTG